jgi:hypothetical protein
MLDSYRNVCAEGTIQPCSGPGHQVVIQFDTDGTDVDSTCSVMNGFDCMPEIRIVYLHTQADDPVWDTQCSIIASQSAQLDIWLQMRQRAECGREAGDPVGSAANLGFTSGPHLHYAVYIDRNGNAVFRPEDDFNETVDPLIAHQMRR